MKVLIKVSLVICVIALLANRNLPRSIYSIPFNDIDGKTMDLMPYRGKKLMVLVVSGQDKDSMLMNRLASFCQRYKDSISIVIIPSIEDGYSETDKAILKQRFTERNLKVLITEGVYTRKNACSNQAGLMQWLTIKSNNMREDRDIMGAGHRFLLDEFGGLQYSVVPSVPYTAPFIENYMSWPVRPYPVMPVKDPEKK